MSAIVGYGSHGRDIEAIWRRVHPGVWIEKYDDQAERGRPLPEVIDDFYLGPYYPKWKVDLAARITGRLAPPLIDPTAQVGPDCSLHPGVVVAAQAVLDTEVEVGEHSHINYSVAMTRTRIGEFCTISPGVVICGDVTIGNRVFIGAGAVICNLVTIEDDAWINPGAVVAQHVPEGVKVRP